MKIGVTGAEGFIGSYLVSALYEQRKDIEIIAGNSKTCNLLDKSALENFVTNLDLIVHVAGVNRGTDTEIIAGNIVGSYNLLNALIEQNKKVPIIFISSIQSGNETVFGKSKKLVEIMLEDISKRLKLPVTIFRVTNVFGEGGQPFYNSVFATFSHQVASGLPLSVNSDAELHLLYIKDLIKKLVEEIFKEHPPEFKLETLSSDNVITVKQLADLIMTFPNIKSDTELKSRFHKDLYNAYKSYEKSS